MKLSEPQCLLTDRDILVVETYEHIEFNYLLS